MSNAYFTFCNLSPPAAGDLKATFQRMAEILERSPEPARIQFQLLERDHTSYWGLALGPTDCRVYAEKDERPDFEIITRAETWRSIAEGSLAPFRAFIQGKMRVRGDLELGQRILQRLAAPE